MKKIGILVGSIILSLSAGILGTLATTPNIPTWYAALDKPLFNPPNWIFGPVWTVLYVMMGISLYLVITSNEKCKPTIYWWFGTQLILNLLWSIIFFGLHAPWAGVITILLLLGSLIGFMILAWQVSRCATYLFIPYLLWVTFATALNISIALLN